MVQQNDKQEIITNNTVDKVDRVCAVFTNTNAEEILHTTDDEILHIDNEETITKKMTGEYIGFYRY